MVKYYCFFKDVERFRPDSYVFKVKIGQSHRDQVKRSLLENFANDCGYYFRPWDDLTLSELILRSTGSWHGSLSVDTMYQTIGISVHDLYHAIIDGRLESLRPCSNFIRNRFRLISMLCPASFTKSSIQKTRNPRQPLSRINLSPRQEWVSMNALVGMGAVVILFLLGALLEGLERSM